MDGRLVLIAASVGLVLPVQQRDDPVADSILLSHSRCASWVPMPLRDLGSGASVRLIGKQMPYPAPLGGPPPARLSVTRHHSFTSTRPSSTRTS